MIVIRDFLDNVDEVLDFAETTPYHDYTYFTGVVFKGLRTPNLVELLPEIVDKINVETGSKPERLYLHKHENLKDFKPIPHVDKSIKSGVIYLKGGQGCGTIVEDKLQEYEFNKLIMYDANLLHQPEGFPEDRLVMTFFCK